MSVGGQNAKSGRLCRGWYHLTLVLLVFFIVSRLSAQTESRRVDFMKDIQPILSSRCYLCHGPGTQMAGLRLDFRESALKGGNSGQKAIVPGDAAHVA